MNAKKGSAENSVYVTLLNCILFQRRQPIFKWNMENQKNYCDITDGFERVVFANSNLDPDDQFYIYECIRIFVNQSTLLEKVQILMDFLNSEDADILIDNYFENYNWSDNEIDGRLKFAKSQVFEKLLAEIIERNNISNIIIEWIFTKCNVLTSNLSNFESFSEENLQDIVEKLK